MATKSYDAALDFMPESKSTKGSPRGLSLFKAVIEAFDEGRRAEARYRELIARGVSHEEAARTVFEVTYKH